MTTQRKNRLFLLSILPTAVMILMALACGGPGASKGASSGSSTGISLKSEKSLPIPENATISIQELGGNILLDRESIQSDSLEVTLPNDVDIVLVLESDGMPFLRTVMSGEQVAAAVASGSGILDPGEFSAVTTYLAGLVEVQVHGNRFKARGKGEVEALLEENFGNSASTFADLTYDRFLGGTMVQSEAFRQRINRINLLKVYFHTFRQFDGADETGRAAVQSLYAAIFDETDPTRLINALASPALPAYDGKGDGDAGLAQLSALAAESVFLEGNGALTLDELGHFFFDPASNQYLTDKVLFSPTGEIVGSVVGQQLEGVSISLTGAKGYHIDTASEADGSFIINGLDEDTFTLTVSAPGLVFDEPSRTVTLAKSESLQGVTFVNLIDRGAVTVAPDGAGSVLPEGYYDTVTVTGDGNLLAQNIRLGVTVFGVTGSVDPISETVVPSDGSALAEDIRAGSTAYAGGNLITGTLGSTSLDASSSSLPGGVVEATDLTTVDPDLRSENILSGVTVFGVTGNVTATSNTTTITKTLREETMTGGSFILHHE